MVKRLSIIVGIFLISLQSCVPYQMGEVTEVKFPTKTPAIVINPTETESCDSCIEVPEGEIPKIDGVMSKTEWGDAWTGIFSDNSRIFLKINDGYLYLGIQAATKDMIVGNVFINHNDEIKILHSSAALGTAIYKKEGTSWKQDQPFSWRCRETGESESAIKEREDFLITDGWVAANARMGTPNELEYKILVTEETFRIAVNFIEGSKQESKNPWPIGLNDGVITPTPGGYPLEMSFNLSIWGVLRFWKSSPYP